MKLNIAQNINDCFPTVPVIQQVIILILKYDKPLSCWWPFWYLVPGDSTFWTGPGQSSLSAKRTLVSDISSSCPFQIRELCGWRSARGSLGNLTARPWCWPKATAMTQATTVASTRTLKLLLMEPQLPVYMSLFEVTRDRVCLKIL